MTFRPSIHGWPFGDVRPVDAHALGLGSAPAGELGLGGGLCWSALDRYLRGVEVSRRTALPEPGDPLYAELVRRQVAALSGVWNRVEDWQRRPDGSWRDRLPVRLPAGRDAGSLTRSEWPGIRARLDGGEPVLLTLLEPADGYRRSRSARQVLAVSWKRRDRRILVGLYDPSRPGDDDAHLSFERTGALGARLGDGTAVRGFFAVPYDRAVPTALRAETFADRAVIGLNRKVRGRLEPVASRGRIDVVARDPDGALLHFRRESGRSWEGSNVTDRHELGSFELHSDPSAVARGRGLDIFARSYVGDLIHFRFDRSWEVSNRTEHKRAGARFRLRGRPTVTAGSWKQLSVVGVDKDGGLVHYWHRPLRGWRAEQVAGDPLSEDPVAVRVDGDLHVLGVGMDGRLRHWAWDGTSWTAGVPATGPELDDDVRLAPGMTVEVVDGGFIVAVRSRNGRLVTYRRAHGGTWTQEVLAEEIAGPPAACEGPAGLHLFAPREDGGLLHAWHDGRWATEDVLATRPSLGRLPRTGRLAAWGSPSELRVWARDDRDLWSLHWRADADWSGEHLSERAGVEARHLPGDDPVVLTDDRGHPHLFFTDGRGTVQHVEPGEWKAPGYPDVAGEAAPVDPTTSVAPAPEAEADTARSALPEPVPLPEPLPLLEPEAEPEPEPEPLPLLDPPDELETPVDAANDGEATESVPPTTDPGAGPAPDLPYLDFEADPPPPREFGYDGGRIESEPEPGVEEPEVDEPPEEPTAAVEAVEPEVAEPEAAEPEAAEPEATEPVADAGSELPELEVGPEEPEPAPEPTSKRKYPQIPRFGRASRQEREAAEADPGSTPDVEPMDLTLMDSWPPPSRSGRRRKGRGGDEREREAS